MRRVLIVPIVASLFGALAVAPVAAVVPPSYTIVDLGAPTNYSIGYGINETPVVVGHLDRPGLSAEAARWDAGVASYLGSLNNAGHTLARAVNESGLIVGESYDGLGGVHAVTWTGTAVTDLGTLTGNSSTAFAVNDSGQVAGDGQSSTGYSHALLWDGGAPVDLGVLPGGNASHGRGINNSGQVTGDSESDSDGRTHAVIWETGAITDLGTLPGDDISNAVAINDAGHVTGRSLDSNGSGQFGFFWDGSSMIEIPLLRDGSFLEAAAINDNDQVVGRGDRFNSYQSAFLWEASTGETVDLQTLLPGGSGWQLEKANAINNAGQITGYGVHDSVLRAFLMTPSTDPAPTDTVVEEQTAGGSVSTDTGAPGATADDPLATTVQTPVDSVVTIREGVGFTGVPGFTVLGQPVTISAEPSDPSHPFVITFVFDASVIPAGEDETTISISRDGTIAGTCLDNAVADPDPCVRDRQRRGDGDVSITVLTSHASAWEALVRAPTPVSVSDSGFSPNVVSLMPGGVVRWTFGGTRKHSVTNDQKLATGGKPLFDSSARTTGQFDYTFVAAGTYTYRSTSAGDGKFAGSVAVPVVVTPSSGSTTTTFNVVWASASLSGYVFDVQVRFQKAGSKQWSAWTSMATGTTARSGTLTPTSAGTYSIRALLRNPNSGKASAWSPTVLVSAVP